MRSDSDAPLLLEAVGASKGFPGVQALEGVDLGLRHGEVLAVVGENGAGKSTLMKLLSGIYKPDRGEFFLEGQPLQILGPKHAQELGISIIHQEFNLMPDLTVAQNIFIGRERRRGGIFLSERDLNRAAQELFDRLGLALEPTAVVSSLTVAKQQMVEIAKALSWNARVLIMDEPTAALNDAEAETLFSLIRRFVTPQTGVIYISHRMNELKQISDRITVLRDGRNVETLVAESTPISKVVSLMVGRDIAGERRPGKAAHGEVVLSVSGLGTPGLLQDVSFDLRRGEILGFAGLMGAGRTEVARAIVGADRISAGQISVHGTTASISSPVVASRLGIGYLSEDRKQFGVLLERSVRENVILSSMRSFYGALGVMRERKIDETAQSFVTSLRIKTPSVTQLVKNLSGGNQQKVVIAKWLVRDCDVLIFDEPTRGIDVGAKDEIYALLNELAASGKSILMISSELPEILQLSHRIAVMCQGRLTAVLNNADATQENIMAYATGFSSERTVEQ